MHTLDWDVRRMIEAVYGCRVDSTAASECSEYCGGYPGCCHHAAQHLPPLSTGSVTVRFVCDTSVPSVSLWLNWRRKDSPIANSLEWVRERGECTEIVLSRSPQRHRCAQITTVVLSVHSQRNPVAGGVGD